MASLIPIVPSTPAWNNSRRDWYTHLTTVNRSVSEAEREPTEERLFCFVIDVNSSSIPTSRVPVEIKKKMDINPQCREISCLNVYGVTSSGESVYLCLIGEYSYLVARQSTPEIDLCSLKQKIEELMNHETHNSVHKIELFNAESLYGYMDGKGITEYIRVYMTHHTLLPKLKGLINRSQVQGLDPLTYECGIPYDLRCLVDLDMSGCGWISVPFEFMHREQAYKSELHKEIGAPSCTIGRFGLDETSQLDVSTCMSGTCHTRDVAVIPTRELDTLPTGIRILSFDIECVTESGKGFPKPELDPIVTIAMVLADLGGTILDKVIFCMRETATVPDALVVWFEREEDMLNMFCEYIRVSDPDVITGYNCFNFDMNYIDRRAAALKMNRNFLYISRSKHVSTVSDARLASKALGIKQYKSVDIKGRLCVDLLDVIRRDYKLKSYTLNAVSAHFLNSQKEDVPYKIIGDLYNGTPDTRRRIASYCLKDAALPMKLLNKLLVLVNLIEMARVTGVPVSFLLNRGQQIKVTSQILRMCKQVGFVMPVPQQQDNTGDKYEGATVLEPERGFYTQPITTLDFASLYPSIMIAHNICYSTLLPPGWERSYLGSIIDTNDVTKTPAGCSFVKQKVRNGILPEIVNDLIEARKETRAMIKQTDDSMRKMVLNGRQLALKISANSVYGYTGAAAAGQLPCLEVSTSITAFGRQMIDQTKCIIESEFSINNGYMADAKVVYGDTDSVMIDFGTGSLKKAMEYGDIASQLVNTKFISPIRIEFEKVFKPFLLMNKKRYAGLLYTNPDSYDKLDCKGIETVRRDFCGLTQQTVEKVLHKILVDVDVDGAISYVKGIIQELLTNKVDMSLLVMTKSIGKEEYDGKVAHVELAKRMRIRDPGSAPAVGDRVHYVVIAGDKSMQQYERAEDPLYVLDNNLAIDSKYYLDSLKNPVCRILEPCMKTNPETIFTAGDHTRTKVQQLQTGSALSKLFSTKVAQCMSCRVTLKGASKDEKLCRNCFEEKGVEICYKKMEIYSEAQKEYNLLWSECQRCQGSHIQDIICTSRDCPIFYRRKKASQQLKRADEDARALVRK